jgi:hypothetical protein
VRARSEARGTGGGGCRASAGGICTGVRPDDLSGFRGTSRGYEEAAAGTVGGCAAGVQGAQVQYEQAVQRRRGARGAGGLGPTTHWLVATATCAPLSVLIPRQGPIRGGALPRHRRAGQCTRHTRLQTVLYHATKVRWSPRRTMTFHSRNEGSRGGG